VAQKTRVVRAKSWEELPEILEPGTIYDVDGVMIKPMARLSRDEAKGIALGVREMACRQA